MSDFLWSYQLFVESRMNRGAEKDELTNWALGLNGEAGEVAEMIKKYVFHDHKLDIEELEKEIGDVAFYMVAICNTLNLDMTRILQINQDKLTKRYPDGFDSEKSKNRDT